MHSQFTMPYEYLDCIADASERYHAMAMITTDAPINPLPILTAIRKCWSVELVRWFTVEMSVVALQVCMCHMSVTPHF